MSEPSQSEKLLQFGYYSAFALAMVAMIGSMVYMFVFSQHIISDTAPATAMELLDRTASKRLLLLSTGILSALTFGFLGFALFLMQVKGQVNAGGNFGGASVTLAKLSPGLFVIACSTLIIVLCATSPIEYHGNESPKKQAAQVQEDTAQVAEAVAEPAAEDTQIDNYYLKKDTTKVQTADSAHKSP